MTSSFQTSKEKIGLLVALMLDLRDLAEYKPNNISEAAQLVSGILSLTNEMVNVPRRIRRGSGEMSVEIIWSKLEKCLPDLVDYMMITNQDSEKMEKIAKHRLMAISIHSQEILACENIKRALSGDQTRAIIALPPPEEEEKKGITMQDSAKQKSSTLAYDEHIDIDTFSSDLGIITTNLFALKDIAEAKPFNEQEAGLLCGPIIDLIDKHVSMKPVRFGPDTSMSRQWIISATKDCLNKLHSIADQLPSLEENNPEAKLSITRKLICIMITIRDIYLAENIQTAAKRTI